MATEVTYSEVQCVIEITPTLKTQRITRFILGCSSHRISLLNYRQVVFDARKSYFQTNPVGSEKWAITGKRVAQIIKHEQTKQYLPYFISPDKELFVKLTLNPNETITFYIDTSPSSPQPQDENVVTLFDDFKSGLVDGSKWSAHANNISFTPTTIICSGGNTNLTTTNLGTLEEYVVRYRAKQYSDSSRWGCSYYDEIIDTNNSHTNFYNGSNSTWTNFFSTGASSSLTNLPVYDWHVVEIEYSKSQKVGRFYFNGELKLEKQVPEDKGVASYFKFYSCRRMEYDYILIYKKNPSTITITTKKISTSKYYVKVTNNSSSTISQEIKIDNFTPPSTSLSIYIPSTTYTYLDYFTHNNSRFAYTEKGLPGQNDRYAIFIPNIGVIVSSPKVILPFMYSDDKVVYVGNQLLTQRPALYTTTSPTERKAELKILNNVHYVSSTITIQPLHYHTHRKCYIEQNYNYTKRFGQFTLQFQSETTCYVHSYNMSLITTPIIISSISNIYGEVVGFTHTYNPLSERLALLQRNPDTLRYAIYLYTTSSTRYSTYQTSQLKLLHDTTLIQCHPYYSDRVGVVRGFQWCDERNSYYKVGDVRYVLKPAYSTSPKLSLISKNQLEKVFKFYTETNSEIFVVNGHALAKEYYNIYLQGISGLTTHNSILISAVEAINGVAITDGIERKRKILAIGKFIANACIRYKSDRYAITKAK